MARIVCALLGALLCGIGTGGVIATRSVNATSEAQTWLTEVLAWGGASIAAASGSILGWWLPSLLQNIFAGWARSVHRLSARLLLHDVRFRLCTLLILALAFVWTVYGRPVQQRWKQQHLDSALLEAVGYGNLAVGGLQNADNVRSLLVEGANVNAVGEGLTGRRVLSSATMALDQDGDTANMVRFLLSHGAEVNGRDRDGGTALMGAVWNACPLTAYLLLKNGANVNVRDRGGTTALMCAAKRRSVRMTRLLLEHRAAVDATDWAGRSALFWATAFYDPATLHELLLRGANVNKKDTHGVTPLREAYRRRKEVGGDTYRPVIWCLKRVGAKLE